jgi:hypothetical protein
LVVSKQTYRKLSSAFLGDDFWYNQFGHANVKGKKDFSEYSDQGDPVGRILASWAIVYFGKVFSSKVARMFGYFIHRKSCVSMYFGKNGIGRHFGQFFSQKHPVTLARTLPWILLLFGQNQGDQMSL